jgi:hypothetical protein
MRYGTAEAVPYKDLAVPTQTLKPTIKRRIHVRAKARTSERQKPPN